MNIPDDYISRKAVIDITAETGALTTQMRVMELPAVNVKSDWIKTKDRYPDRDGSYLIYFKKQVQDKVYECVDIMRYSTQQNCFITHGIPFDIPVFEVTHWQSLPEKPEE